MPHPADNRYLCPFCGSEATVGGPCPGCAPEWTGKARRSEENEPHPWEQDESLDGLDLPDGDFDYDDFISREFGGAPHRRLGVKWYWWALGGLAAAALLLWTLVR